MSKRNHSDRRRRERDRLEARTRLVWYGAEGEIYYAWGKCINISQTGMQVELNSYSEKSSDMRTVTFRFTSPDCFAGSASVRYSNRRGMKTVVGLEFTGGLEWHPDQFSSVDLALLAERLTKRKEQPVAVT